LALAFPNKKNNRNKTNNPDSCTEESVGALSPDLHYFPPL